MGKLLGFPVCSKKGPTLKEGEHFFLLFRVDTFPKDRQNKFDPFIPHESVSIFHVTTKLSKENLTLCCILYVSETLMEAKTLEMGKKACLTLNCHQKPKS